MCIYYCIFLLSIFQSCCIIAVFVVSSNVIQLHHDVHDIYLTLYTGDNWNNDMAKNNLKRNGAFSEPNATMEVAQLLLSLLHAWGMDPDLDRVCEGKLGLLRPMVPVSFGVLSKGGTF